MRLLKLVILFTPLAANAHHSFGALYDLQVTKEVAGEITSVSWTNPHVRITIDVDGTEWIVEGQARSQLSRMKVNENLIEVGDMVRIAGHPSRREPHTLYWSHLLLSDGREVLMRPSLTSRWTDNVIGDDSLITSDGQTGNAEAGLFRVWSTNVDVLTNFPLARPRDYPLTESARAHERTWDINQTVLTCSSYGMPTIIDSPDPIEFVDSGDSIQMRMETFNAKRIIHMVETEGLVEPSPMGYSTGYWEDETLVVNTTHISWPYFNQLGVPLSEKAEFVEYFEPSATRLDYRIVVTDSNTFTEPVTLSKYWTWLEDIQIEYYENDPDCA